MSFDGENTDSHISGGRHGRFFNRDDLKHILFSLILFSSWPAAQGKIVSMKQETSSAVSGKYP